MQRKKLKILQIVPYFYPAWAYGGTPRAVFELSRGLVQRGHEVTVCTTDVFDKSSRYESSGGVSTVEGIKIHYFRNLNNSLAYNQQLFLPRGLASFMRKNISHFDIIHLNGHRHFLNNIAHYYAKKFSIPYVMSAHGTVLRITRKVFSKVIFDKVFGDRVLKDAARFVAVSETEINQYEQMGLARDKISLIYNGMDFTPYETLPQKNLFRKKYGLQGKKIILFLGRIAKEKGVDFLVNAFSEINQSDTTLVIAGNDMGFKASLDDIISKKSLEKRVIYTGFLGGEDKLAAMCDADVLVYPSVEEIFGLVPFEAIMCGTPVIVTGQCGCGKIINSENIGYTVRYGDNRALKTKITTLLGDNDNTEAMVRRGQQFIRENLSIEKAAKRHEALYRSLV